MKITLFLLVSFTSAFSEYIQACPKLTSNEDIAGRAVSYNSTGRSNLSRCRVVYYSGTVESLIYKDAQPTALILEYPNKKKVQIAFDDDSLEYFSAVDRQRFTAQLTKGVKVSIGAFVCGTGKKAHKQIFSMEFV